MKLIDGRLQRVERFHDIQKNFASKLNEKLISKSVKENRVCRAKQFVQFLFGE